MSNEFYWVEIGGCQYEITEGELLYWLNLFGDVLSKISEMKHPDSEAVIFDKLNDSLIIFL